MKAALVAFERSVVVVMDLDNSGLSSIFGKADLTLTRTLLIESGEVNGLFWAYLTVEKTESGNTNRACGLLRFLRKEQTWEVPASKVRAFLLQPMNSVNPNIKL